MTTDNNLISQIHLIFSQKLLLEVESAETDLLETGVLDSMSLVDLLLHLDQQLGFSTPIETLELENFRSIARIAEMVGNHRNSLAARTA